MKDLHLLPRVSDGWTYLYAEHCRVEQDDKAIALYDARGKVAVPCAMLATLMLGPGVTITHAAVRVLAEHGCLVIWGGEEGGRFYAQGMGDGGSGREDCPHACGGEPVDHPPANRGGSIVPTRVGVNRRGGPPPPSRPRLSPRVWG